MSESAKILLVDDQPANLDVLRHVLEREGYQVLLAPNGEVALRNAARALPDLILLDVTMPEMDGHEVCRRLKADAVTADIPVIFCTARDLHEDIVLGFELGAVDYVIKPFQEAEVLKRVESHVRMHQLARELRERNDELREEIDERERLDGRLSVMSAREQQQWDIDGFVGKSATMQRIFTEIQLVQGNPTTSVLISGESGTGKELIARAIHSSGPRKDGPFVPLNCAALPRELAESLLFGHRKGAFTGADADRAGVFEAAHEGTLFLDEIGEMPLELQPKLLRVLEDGEVIRVGATEGRKVDVRVVAATNVELEQRIQDGRFRQDLYYRLARFTVTSPPLRERPDDIPLLADHFAQMLAVQMGRPTPTLSAAATCALRGYAFPGNVRELRNLLERALLELGDGDVIEADHLRFPPTGTHGSGGNGMAGNGPGGSNLALPLDLDEAVAAAERWVIEQALAQCDGNVSAATRLLGTTRNRVYRIIGQDGKTQDR
ncbi:MAG: sigma-54-dependent Fis family transcriptional regulator [Gemmatimonadetes bacterium]|nr:sigma-54-dependent Fis family transcriptional regulator [Gemmatimonadota bacterium]